MEARIISAEQETRQQNQKQKSITMPAVQSAMNYLLKHHKKKIIGALNHSMESGELNRAFGRDVSGCVVTESNVKFVDMDYWRIDMYQALVDIHLVVSINTLDVPVIAGINGELKINTKYKFGMEFGNFYACSDMPNRTYTRMSAYFVPYLKKEELEEEMNALLTDYGVFGMKEGAYRRARMLAENMGLNVITLALYKNKRTESILFFRESQLLVQAWDEDGNEIEPYIETIPANTIVLNSCALHKDQCATPIFHECVHYHLHFMFYRLQQMYNDNDLKHIGKKHVVIRDNMKIPQNPIKWMEWQAKRGAYALMMPREFMQEQIKKRYENCCVSFHIGSKMDVIGRGIAKDYDIPKFRVRARMIQVGWIEAEGALNYIDDRYIEPFAFSRENYEYGHSFVIDSVGIREAYETDVNFRDRLDSGYYVYADGHIVINDPQYVRSGWKGLKLTPMANAHVDLCCLRFMHVYESDDEDDLTEFYYGALNSDEEYNRDYFAFVDDGRMDDIAKYKAMGALLAKMPKTFNEALKYLMEQSGHTEEMLAEAAGVSVKTIERRRNDIDTPYRADQIVPICLALHLPPIISNHLMTLAGVSLNMMNTQHQGYRILLDCMYMDSMEDIQRNLLAMGYKQFNNTYKTV